MKIMDVLLSPWRGREVKIMDVFDSAEKETVVEDRRASQDYSISIKSSDLKVGQHNYSISIKSSDWKVGQHNYDTGITMQCFGSVYIAVGLYDIFVLHCVTFVLHCCLTLCLSVSVRLSDVSRTNDLNTSNCSF